MHKTKEPVWILLFLAFFSNILYMAGLPGAGSVAGETTSAVCACSPRQAYYQPDAYAAFHFYMRVSTDATHVHDAANPTAVLRCGVSRSL